MHNNTTVSKYFDAITAEAQKAKDAAEQMYKEYKSTRISEYKKQVKEESNREIGRRTSVIRQNIGKEYSIKETELRKQIFVKREEIFNNVFEEAKNELVKYANSSEYEAFIESSINQIKSAFYGRDKKITVYLREKDMNICELIEKQFDFPCNFIIDDTISIGGIKAKFAKCIIDDTLDSRLKSQHSWFEENSGLDIK